MKIVLAMANYVLNIINYHFLSFLLNSRYKKMEMVEISQMTLST